MLLHKCPLNPAKCKFLKRQQTGSPREPQSAVKAFLVGAALQMIKQSPYRERLPLSPNSLEVHCHLHRDLPWGLPRGLAQGPAWSVKVDGMQALMQLLLPRRSPHTPVGSAPTTFPPQMGNEPTALLLCCHHPLGTCGASCYLAHLQPSVDHQPFPCILGTLTNVSWVMVLPAALSPMASPHSEDQGESLPGPCGPYSLLCPAPHGICAFPALSGTVSRGKASSAHRAPCHHPTPPPSTPTQELLKTF